MGISLLIQSNFIGNKDIEKYLLSLIKGGNFPNVLLFSGRKGVGKVTLAYQLCQFLFQNVNNISDLLHENLLVCSSKKGDLLTLDCIKSIRNFVAIKSIRCSGKINKNSEIFSFISHFKNDKYLDKKVVIIDSIDTMNIQSQNALLKTIEEAENVIFILISHQSSKVILPIISRCSKFLFKPLSEDELSSILKSIYNIEDYNKLERFIPISNGSVDLSGIFFSFHDRYFEMLEIFKKSLLLSNKKISGDLGDNIFDFAKNIVSENAYFNFTVFYNNFWVRMFYYLISNKDCLLSEEKEISKLFNSDIVKNFYFNYWIESRSILQSSLNLNTNKNIVMTYVMGRVLN